MKAPPGRRIINAEVPQETYDRLRAVAKQREHSMSQLVRLGLRHVLIDLELEETASPAGRDGLEDQRAGATRGPQ